MNFILYKIPLPYARKTALLVTIHTKHEEELLEGINRYY